MDQDALASAFASVSRRADHTEALHRANVAQQREAASGRTVGESTSSGGGFKPFGDDGLTFYDILDIVNPLQHIPIVSSIYRAVTGDTIDLVPRLAGGALFGGIFGAGAALGNGMIQALTGDDLGGHAVTAAEALFDWGSTSVEAAAPTAIAIDSGASLPSWGEPGAFGEAPTSLASAIAAYGDTLSWARRDRTFEGVMAAAPRMADGLPPPERRTESQARLDLRS